MDAISVSFSRSFCLHMQMDAVSQLVESKGKGADEAKALSVSQLEGAFLVWGLALSVGVIALLGEVRNID